jgi:tetratricopeptide (TPR) repeat protein
VLTNLANVLCDMGRLDEACHNVKRAIELAMETGSPRTEAEALNAAAVSFIAQGETEQALRHAERAHQLALDVGVRQPEIAALIGQAAAHYDFGSPALGQALASQGLQLAASNGFAFLAGRATSLLTLYGPGNGDVPRPGPVVDVAFVS